MRNVVVRAVDGPPSLSVGDDDDTIVVVMVVVVIMLHRVTPIHRVHRVVVVDVLVIVPFVVVHVGVVIVVDVVVVDVTVVDVTVVVVVAVVVGSDDGVGFFGPTRALALASRISASPWDSENVAPSPPC